MRVVYAVDLETTSLSPDEGDIRLVAVTGADGSRVTSNVRDVETILRDPSVLKVFHNSLFDAYWLRRKKFEVRNFADTMVLSQVLHGDVKAGNKLVDLAKQYLGLELNKELQSAENWLGELTDQHVAYATADSEATYRLYPILMDRIRERGLEAVAERETRALTALIRMQSDGILFDYEGWTSELDRYVASAQALQEDIRAKLECPELNLGSSVQLKSALLSVGVNVSSTKQEELAKFGYASPVVEMVLRHKKALKILSAYGDKLLRRIGSDGRLRGDWRLLGTVTGRSTCSNPNLQGLPKTAKRFCVAEPGWSIVTADFSQIELRVLAELSGDPEMLQSFRDGKDLHRKTAAKVFAKSEEDVTDRERQAGKVINFGLVYGMTAFGLRNKLSAQEGLSITLEQAERFRNDYFELYPGVLRFQDTMLRSSRVKSLGGRHWDSKALKEIMRFNYPIQSTAAEGFKESLILLNDRMPGHWRLIAAIHDELVVEVPEQEVERAEQLLQDCMTTGMGCLVTGVPIEVDVNAGAHWIK
ncbi:DNA polymerase [Alicyclobacillus sp. ALC3]|uniref:DNA polymerase n=1 Tax=Alicyclobacillus sp. ALC3 TaxID=2796143 RepID=UPI0023785884|nr:DNA polymerase [Alicyclobacillus sp. ALC3]WDL99191.1 hypothetical protein JC200_11420 [Alicyclobacillus sp. ALC3]